MVDLEWIFVVEGFIEMEKQKSGSCSCFTCAVAWSISFVLFYSGFTYSELDKYIFKLVLLQHVLHNVHTTEQRLLIHFHHVYTFELSVIFV